MVIVSTVPMSRPSSQRAALTLAPLPAKGSGHTCSFPSHSPLAESERETQTDRQTDAETAGAGTVRRLEHAMLST
jgi:hypothetical protein